MTKKIKRGSVLLKKIRKEGILSTNPKFETIATVKKRKKAYIKALEGTMKPKQLRLAMKLRRCKKGKRCGSGACPTCCRLFRKRAIMVTLEVIPDLDKIMLATWLCYKDVIPKSKLKSFLRGNLAKLKNRMQQQLKRLDIQVPLIGGFEFVYLPEDEVWLPHFHCIALTDDRKELEPFRKYLLKNTKSQGLSQAFRPLAIDTITENHSSTIGYCYKAFWQRKNKNNRFAGKELSGKLLTDSLLSLDKLGQREKLFLFKFKSVETTKGLKIIKL